MVDDRMLPVERPIGAGGKVVIALLSAAALALAVLGLFTARTLSVGPLTVGRGWFPALIALLLVGVLASVLLAQGRERCRFCRSQLCRHGRRFAVEQLAQLELAVSSEDAGRLPRSLAGCPAKEPAAECVELVVSLCPAPCRKAGTVELELVHGGAARSLGERRVIAGPTVTAFLAAVEATDGDGPARSGA